MKKNYQFKSKLSTVLLAAGLMVGGKAHSQTVQAFAYTGSVQTFVVPPCVNQITLEVWGAQGGGVELSSNSSSGSGGRGGYAKGTLTVTPGSTLYVYVGGFGQSSSSGPAAGGFNGGGSGYASSSGEPGNGGGGASDIRVGGQTFNDRVIVAGGGGGGGEDSGDPYGEGGGLTGVGYSSYDATQTSAGAGGGFGFGGTTGQGDGGGGGGGWYGGGTYSTTSIGTDTQGGGGGSGYVGVLTQTTLIDGSSSMPNPAGGTMTGRSGNGYARMTYMMTGSPVSVTNATAAICTAGSVALNATGAVSYTWVPVGGFGGSNSGTVVVSPSSNTTYTVSGTNAQGCVTTATANVKIDSAPPVLSVTSNTTSVCLGQAVLLNATGANTHTWTGGITNNVAFFPQTSTVYTVTGTNGCGTATSAVSVTVAPLAVGAVASNTLVCQLNSVTLTAAGGTSYTWMPGSMTQPTAIVFPSANTIYTVSATDGTCSGSATVAVNTNTNPILTIAASNSNICQGETVTLTVTGANSYTWANAPISGGTGTVMPTAPTLFQVTGSNQFGCTAQASQIVLVNPAPNISVSNNKPLICAGDPATLIVSGNASTYTWNTSATTKTIVVMPSVTSTYTVTGVSSAGCPTTQAISVNVFLPELSVSPSATICQGSAITLTAGAGSGHQWLPGGQTGFQSIQVKPAVPTTYTVSAMTTSGSISCPASNTVHVGLNSRPTVGASASRTVMCRTRESVTLTANGAGNYLWSLNNATSASLVFTTNIVQTHTFSVIGTDNNGCKDTAYVSVVVQTCTGLNEESASGARISVYPNPNGGVFAVQSDKAVRLSLVNQLGQVVRTLDLNESNMYQMNVQELSQGVYYLTGDIDNRKVTQKIIVTR